MFGLPDRAGNARSLSIEDGRKLQPIRQEQCAVGALPSRTVQPSRGDLATMSLPIVPEAPGLWSTMTVGRHDSCSLAATRRASVQDPQRPPIAPGTVARDMMGSSGVYGARRTGVQTLNKLVVRLAASARLVARP